MNVVPESCTVIRTVEGRGNAKTRAREWPIGVDRAVERPKVHPVSSLGCGRRDGPEYCSPEWWNPVVRQQLVRPKTPNEKGGILALAEKKKPYPSSAWSVSPVYLEPLLRIFSSLGRLMAPSPCRWMASSPRRPIGGVSDMSGGNGQIRSFVNAQWKEMGDLSLVEMEWCGKDKVLFWLSLEQNGRGKDDGARAKARSSHGGISMRKRPGGGGRQAAPRAEKGRPMASPIARAPVFQKKSRNSLWSSWTCLQNMKNICEKYQYDGNWKCCGLEVDFSSDGARDGTLCLRCMPKDLYQTWRVSVCCGIDVMVHFPANRFGAVVIATLTLVSTLVVIAIKALLFEAI